MEVGEKEGRRSEDRPCRAGPGAPVRDTGQRTGWRLAKARGGWEPPGRVNGSRWRLLIPSTPGTRFSAPSGEGEDGGSRAGAGARRGGAGGPRALGRGGPCPQRAGLQPAPQLRQRAPGPRSLSSRGWGRGAERDPDEDARESWVPRPFSVSPAPRRLAGCAPIPGLGRGRRGVLSG